jgi:hypothetical protein
MSLEKLVEDTTSALLESLPDHEFTEEQKKAIQALIENSMVQTVREARKVNKEAIIQCCGPEADMAHKIADETRRATNSLIANLSSMR